MAQSLAIAYHLSFKQRGKKSKECQSFQFTKEDLEFLNNNYLITLKFIAFLAEKNYIL